jgi:transposase
MAIVDAQSVKNTDTAHLKGYDAGKKVSGIKRHIAVDTNGLPHAIYITAANVTDRTGAIEMVAKTKQNMVLVEKILADGGYTGIPFQEAVKALIGAKVEIAKRNELHKFKVIPKRWVVERSFSWLEKCRRLWKNCERLVTSSLGMVQLAFIRILVKRF